MHLSRAATFTRASDYARIGALSTSCGLRAAVPKKDRTRRACHSAAERESYEQTVCNFTEDMREAIAAYQEKRPPQFKGR